LLLLLKRYLISPSAQLSLPLHLWLLGRSGSNLGVLACVRIVGTSPSKLCSNSVPSIVALSLMNGGTAGGIWMFLTVCVGMFFVVLSMAEMASMYVMLLMYHACY
jgi:hypothetical protein